MNFKEQIEQLVKKNLKTYREDNNRFIADYNHEKELTNEYNGRQLLELLQNADDAESSSISINWKKEQQILIISNKGEFTNPFTIEGIQSLLIANISSKTKQDYIGNKGLGFRSILNWAKEVNIYTRGCEISFSDLIAKNTFENKLGLSESQQNAIRERRKLSLNSIPFPRLATPTVLHSAKYNTWTTTIEISYQQGFESDIENQLNELTEEILLFLNHVQEIEINNNGDYAQYQSKSTPHADYELIQIKNKKWKVFSTKDKLPEEYQDETKEEEQHYQLKVAFQEDLSDEYGRLFNFFPTQISIQLPCIIHGTFDLNSSRNYLNLSLIHI